MSKGIIVVSFGTSFPDVDKRCIKSIEEDIKEVAKDVVVKRAFTSNMIIMKLKRRDDVHVLNCQEAIESMMSEGIDDIFIQPLHIIPGYEYEKIKRAVSIANHNKEVTVTLGKPLLYSEKDYDRVIEALETKMPKETENQAVLLMGHGTEHFANAAYSMLQSKFNRVRKDTFIVNVEGYPEMDDVLEELKVYKKITLMPFMIVAGDHAMNDMAGDDKDSFKSILEVEGILAEAILEGLGENIEIRKIYVERVEEWLE